MQQHQNFTYQTFCHYYAYNWLKVNSQDLSEKEQRPTNVNTVEYHVSGLCWKCIRWYI